MENLTNEALEVPRDFKDFSALNCIDLSSPDILNSVSLLKQACLDSGFFYVINHGISQEFMDEVFYQSKSFFDLPVSEKMKVLRNKKHRGYTPLFNERLDPVNQIHGDYKEGYYIGIEVPENDPDIEKLLNGPNVWPPSDILPGWRETMEKYHREALEVAKAISRIIALALNLEVDFFDRQEMLGKPIATLRLLHYEGRVSDPMKGIYGAGAHSDFGLITLLATDDVYGLQICKDKDAKPQKWEFVAPLKGAFIVNLGDMLERWSNCIFRSTLHRVLGNGQERYSIAYFVEPNHDCLVECLPTCQSQENPPKFAPIKCETYMLQRYKDTHESYEK
ncbi:2-oxoglutarate-Fe(II) type oxidoreductase hxnY [Camellia lanceoleosa]|uniref:2-oxoglutarate-Fe(II) type oxidoreductase hxnY n=1 Tax=Camellia lanceoleosa TaxID=1840588 RepID=A0ACC0FHI3_9ERIC|nr:2-oxoglutarate-Fe(II) type oxidoreductase hxnY [Camellia lanceoleosa]